MAFQIPEETQKRLDKVVKELQEFICVENNKSSGPNNEKIISYLVPISIINKHFQTNYSISYKKYKITELPHINK